MVQNHKKRIIFYRILLNILGSMILAFGLYNIHSLSGITEGGILGLTLLLQHWFGISPSISSFLLSAICYLIGIRVLGRSFLLLSAIAVCSYSGCYAVLEQFPPIYPEIAQYPLLASILGAIFVGIGVGLCVRAGGAPTGDDALAMSLSQKLRCKIQWVYLCSDLSVLILSLTYLPLSKIVFSLFSVVLSGQIIGFVAGSGNGTAFQKKEASANASKS